MKLEDQLRHLVLLPKQKYYVVGGNPQFDYMMQLVGCTRAPNIKAADVVMFQGGADVSPDLYDEKQHYLTHCDQKRDRLEIACFHMAKDKLRVGICRGAQLLNVLSGGGMWQHVVGHAIFGEHGLIYMDKVGKTDRAIVYNVTSTHHQMMRPLKTAEMWATARVTSRRETGLITKGKRVIADNQGKPFGDDPEIVWYPGTSSLCFQPHPEYAKAHTTRELFYDCVERALQERAAI